MRRLIFFSTFSLLLAALFFLWQFRFERVSEYPTLHLGDLRRHSQLPPGALWVGTDAQPILRLSIEPEGPPVVMDAGLPKIGAVDYLHVIYQVSSKDLIPGMEKWEDGRGIIEWQSKTAAGKLENDPMFSLLDTYTSELTEQVMRPEKSPAIPTLRFENLGVSGAFEVSRLEITVLRERLIWKIGRWFLIFGCFAWAAGWCGQNGKFGIIRTSTAALIWLAMVLYCVVPGPWKSLRALGQPFQIGAEISVAQAYEAPPSALNVSDAPRVALPSAGKISVKGDFTLWIKAHAVKARPLLHILLLFGPTLLIACLVGKSPAASLGFILSIGIEAAQASFGFGFDWVDVIDLVCDTAGIGLGLAIAHHPWLRERFRWSSENPCRSVPVE